MKNYPTSIRITKEQKVFLRRMARAQKHGKIATAIRKMIEREMEVSGREAVV